MGGGLDIECVVSRLLGRMDGLVVWDWRCGHTMIGRSESRDCCLAILQ